MHTATIRYYTRRGTGLLKVGLLLCIAFLVFVERVGAQIIPSKDDNRLQYWGDVPGIIEQQNNVSLGWIDQALEKYPPGESQTAAKRKSALNLLDIILHQQAAANSPSVQGFYHLRVERVLHELEDTPAGSGTAIWKLYNSGFIVRTGALTVGFDLIRGSGSGDGGFALANDLARAIIAQCDVLFISTGLDGHADQWVAQAFLDQGKPVIAPPDVWQGELIYDKITHLQRKEGLLQSVQLKDGKTVKAMVYPGHQNDQKTGPQNNVVVVKAADGTTFAHTGNEAVALDWPWIDQVKSTIDVDILMMDGKMIDVKRVLEGFNPKRVLLGNENALDQPVKDRLPYWLDYLKLQDIRIPFYVLAWGEHYSYK